MTHMRAPYLFILISSLLVTGRVFAAEPVAPLAEITIQDTSGVPRAVAEVEGGMASALIILDCGQLNGFRPP